VPVLAQLEKDFPNSIRIVYRNYPLIGTPDKPFHDKAALSTQAAEAAGLQDKFWEMHDLLFNRQTDWASLTVDQFKDWLIARAKDLGLDVKKFTSDLTSPQMVKVAQDAWDNGQKIGLPGTPFLLVNGRIWSNNIPMTPQNLSTNLSMVIKLTELGKKQFTYCPPMAIDMLKQYTATVKTTKGDIVIELYADKAPLAVNSFIFLARNGWFNGVTFHYVIPSVIAQAGDPSGTGFGNPGYAFKNEIAPGLKFDREGVVGMVNAGPDSNNSQFFITLAPAPKLDGNYTIFGQVISGMDVVKNLAPRDPYNNANLPPGDGITSVTITEK